MFCNFVKKKVSGLVCLICLLKDLLRKITESVCISVVDVKLLARQDS